MYIKSLTYVEFGKFLFDKIDKISTNQRPLTSQIDKETNKWINELKEWALDADGTFLHLHFFIWHSKVCIFGLVGANGCF